MARYALTALALVLVPCVTLGPSLGDRAQLAADQAVVTSTYGDVQVRHGTAGWSAARLNEVLKPSDAIKTGADSRAEVTIGRGGYVRMDESSHLLITHLQAGGLTSFKALLGGIWVTIERALTGSSKFQVQMPSAVASVKGTVFRCEVAEDGESATYVYEGEVEVTGDREPVSVAQSQLVRIRPGATVAAAPLDLDADDLKPWVQYNRCCDILRYTGNPSILVALTEDGVAGEDGLFLASQALAHSLRRLGFVAASLSKANLPGISVGDDGLIRWRQQPHADYAVLGRVEADEPTELADGTLSARLQGTALLVKPADREPILTVTSVASAHGTSRQQAVSAALVALGARLGADLGPRTIRETMARHGGAVRVSIIGSGDRAQIALLHRLLAETPGVVRVAPLAMPGSRVSLAVAGQLSPERIAAALPRYAGQLVESVQVADHTVFVRLKRAPPSRPGPQGQRPPGVGPPFPE